MKKIDKSKHGIKLEEDVVIKHYDKHEDLINELDVIKQYGIFVNIPEVFFVDDNELRTKYIDGKSLMHNDSKEITSQLIKDLAIFHSMFRVTESVTLYRDSILSNYIMSEDNSIYHIDFSSSNKLVHSFDDLALLLNPNWNKATNEDFVEMYLEHRKVLDKMFIGDYQKYPLTNYSKPIKEMLGINTKESKALSDRIMDTSFENLRLKDYSAFSDFRTIRAEFYLNKWSK